MAVSPPPEPVFEADAPNRPPAWWRRALGALLFAAASAVMAVAALAAVSAPVDLLWPSEYTALAPGAIAAGGVAGLLVLLGLWAVLGRTLRGLGVRRAAATAALALVVPVGYAAARVALYGPVEALGWATGLAAASGALVCVAVTGPRGRGPVAVAAGLALAVLVGGVAVENEVARIAPRAEFDRHTAVPVLRHPDWDLAHVEPYPAQGDVLVEYRHTKRADAEPLLLYTYRPDEKNWRLREYPDPKEDYEVVEHEKFTLLVDPLNGPSLYLDLDSSTQVQVTRRSGATQEELVSLVGYIGAATDIERAELRGEIGPPRHG